MVKWLKSFFTPEVQYSIVEVERPRPLVDLRKMKDGEAAVASLEGHPGWQYLLAKFRIQKAALERSLHSELHTDLSAVLRLQAGVFWCGWLESQLTSSKSKIERAAQAPSTEELAMLKEIMGAMTQVGTS